MGTRIGMVSLGCAKNRVDAEMMLYTLKNAGYELAADPSMSDVVIVNTCGFIEDAKQESIDEILELASLKKDGRIKGIIVTGCLAERYQHEVMKELYEVDAVLGIGANKDIVAAVEKVLDGEKQELYPDKTDLALCGGRIRTTPFYYSYLKIAEGCDNKCTYCAIPMISVTNITSNAINVFNSFSFHMNNRKKQLVILSSLGTTNTKATKCR